ncbi:hypothetical protein CEXT_606621 [Caerostris extrusa]|uniref:Uncharacterized protein n=1 Tax=Caerostris extrusa TaxID=172846 RepID=A0AAV4UYQ4_CAEEX|nr:hypothetical protein CEXT_606621 [Caerostris extrusa]
MDAWKDWKLYTVMAIAPQEKKKGRVYFHATLSSGPLNLKFKDLISREIENRLEDYISLNIKNFKFPNELLLEYRQSVPTTSAFRSTKNIIEEESDFEDSDLD